MGEFVMLEACLGYSRLPLGAVKNQQRSRHHKPAALEPVFVHITSCCRKFNNGCRELLVCASSLQRLSAMPSACQVDNASKPLLAPAIGQTPAALNLDRIYARTSAALCRLKNR